MASIEILRGHPTADAAEPMLAALARAARAAGDIVRETKRFEGRSDWLVLFGIGAPPHNEARNAQLKRGGRALLWDLGYTRVSDGPKYLRMSIDEDHPNALDRTPNCGRFEELGLSLREDANSKGPIILVGLGRKSRAYLGLQNWEQRMLQKLRKRYPGRAIVFRPKGSDTLRLDCRCDSTTPFEKLLRGASLVVCRHSNCAVDAVIAGVPFQAEAGAASWLRRFTREARLDFLQRLAWWQWRHTEAAEALNFAKGIVST